MATISFLFVLYTNCASDRRRNKQVKIQVPNERQGRTAKATAEEVLNSKLQGNRPEWSGAVMVRRCSEEPSKRQ